MTTTLLIAICSCVSQGIDPDWVSDGTLIPASNNAQENIKYYYTQGYCSAQAEQGLAPRCLRYEAFTAEQILELNRRRLPNDR